MEHIDELLKANGNGNNTIITERKQSARVVDFILNDGRILTGGIFRIESKPVIGQSIQVSEAITGRTFSTTPIKKIYSKEHLFCTTLESGKQFMKVNYMFETDSGRVYCAFCII